MKKSLDYLLALTIFASSLFVPPQISYGGGYKEDFRRDVERAKQDFRKLKKGYEKMWDKINGENPSERAKDAAGIILENIYGIPQAREMIEYIDKKNREEGFYERQRQKVREYKRKNRSKW